MPIYAYRCAACEHEFEALQKMSDDKLITCPKCAKPELTKLVTAAAFRLKGGGWYESDFKSGNQKNLASSDSSTGTSNSSDSAKSNSSCTTGKCGHNH